MTLDTTLLHEKLLPLIGTPRQNIKRLFTACRGCGFYESEQASEFRLIESRTFNPLSAHGLRHRGSVIPHRRGEEYGRVILSQAIQRGSNHATGPAHLMASDTTLLRKNLPPYLRVSSLLEIVCGVKKSDQVAGLARAQLRARNSRFTHLLTHLRKMVPHRCGKIIK